MTDTPSRTPSTPSEPSRRTTPRRSLPALVGEVPDLVKGLVHAEIQLVKTEVVGKLKSLGIGAGFMVGALLVLGAMGGTLLTAAIAGLAVVMPLWLSALIVSAFLLVVAVVIALIGWRILKRGLPPVPVETIDSVKKDVQSIKGLRKRGQYR